MMTVRQFLETGKHNGVHIMSPGGYIDLTVEQTKDLLAGKQVSAHPGVPNCDMMIDSEEVLEEVIIDDMQVQADGSVSFMTDYVERTNG